jgi:hypothetical protein
MTTRMWGNFWKRSPYDLSPSPSFSTKCTKDPAHQLHRRLHEAINGQLYIANRVHVFDRSTTASQNRSFALCCFNKIKCQPSVNSDNNELPSPHTKQTLSWFHVQDDTFVNNTTTLLVGNEQGSSPSSFESYISDQKPSFSCDAAKRQARGKTDNAAVKEYMRRRPVKNSSLG